VNAEAPIPIEAKPRWRRRLAVALKRSRLVPFVEAAAVLALLLVATATYFIVSGRGGADAPLAPPVVAGLLVANLLPAMVIMVLVARRFAMRRAARSPLGGRGRLHVRLVALFSVVASVPTLLVVIFASVLFQSGVEFWFSNRARGMLENAATIAQESYKEELDRVSRETVTMGGDVTGFVNANSMDHPEFARFLFDQTYVRNLSEAILLRVTPEVGVQRLAMVNPYERSLEMAVPTTTFRQLRGIGEVVVVPTGDRIGAVTKIGDDTYLYAARVFEPRMAAQLERGRAVISAYDALLNRARILQLRFNAALLLVSLLIMGAAIWIAFRVADRLVRPVGDLVDAARRVTLGDLSARVPASAARDEVGTLGNAFNRMTQRLEEQTGALVSANAQLENRRAFIEAVLSGVTAGIISVDQKRNVRLINSSAEALLKTEQGSAVGRKLSELAPELDAHLDGEAREDIVQFASAGEPRTLAVKRVRVEGGHVLTFDDITEQLLDQRRAAWSDVARRIAHEIKNPLTPIQLAAERLQRRYAGEISSDAGTFEKLTGTIVRQVGDLRRMVDEFSSFARMPKPVFREEKIAELAREALFLHQVAHPDIGFALHAPEPSPPLVCDRRQLGQALTNLVKNAVEAIQQKRDEGRKGEADSVSVTVLEGEGRVCVEVRDTGIGLPPDRGRLTEPYMTTRAKGTGLGLAIVKKIVEEHFGSIEFEDAAGGGSLVRLVFDAETLARLAGGEGPSRDIAANG
jgi:two-component system, NtrC family, nitrogen regulation sensor histidine kinase NtrY